MKNLTIWQWIFIGVVIITLVFASLSYCQEKIIIDSTFAARNDSLLSAKSDQLDNLFAVLKSKLLRGREAVQSAYSASEKINGEVTMPKQVYIDYLISMNQNFNQIKNVIGGVDLFITSQDTAKIFR